MSSGCTNDNSFSDAVGWIFFDSDTEISYNNAMSINGFNDSFYLTIGGSDNVDGDGDCDSVDSDVPDDSVVGGDGGGNDDDGRKGEERR